MTTSLKKLLLISITLLLGVISSGVMANTETFITRGGSRYDLTTYSGPDAFAIASNQAWWGNRDLAQAIASQLNLAPSSLGSENGYYGAFVAYSAYGGDYPNILHAYTYQNALLDANSTYTSDTYVVQVGVGAGAPEIDGSLAPKVGFLLGCLFLMFGRKKQNSEPMMTA